LILCCPFKWAESVSASTSQVKQPPPPLRLACPPANFGRWFAQGDAQTANLGDGQGYLNQSGELRYDYGYNTAAAVGTCIESARGGNHLRYWWQNGSLANSGAIFMAVSRELSAAENHNSKPFTSGRGGSPAVEWRGRGG